MAVMNAALLILTTRFLGAEIKGEVSMLVLNLSLAGMLGGLFGGPALVYLTPRFPKQHILALSSSWAIVSSLLFTITIYYLGIGPAMSPFLFLGMAVFETLIGNMLMMLLGGERVSNHNFLQVLKVLVALLSLPLCISLFGNTFQSFYLAYGISLTLTFLASIFLLSRWLQRTKNVKSEHSIFKTLSAGMNYGLTMQLGGIASILTLRLSYYLLEIIISPPSVALVRIGIFSTATQIAESLWQFSKSISTVQYATVSNLKTRSEALEISLKLLRLNYAVTALALIAFLLIPNQFFIAILGGQFSEVKIHLFFLSPGILAVSFFTALNHYFSGVGDQKLNTKTAFIGLIITCLVAVPMISTFDTLGAAALSSLVFMSQAAWQIHHLHAKDQVSLNQFVLKRSDFFDLWIKIRSL